MRDTAKTHGFIVIRIRDAHTLTHTFAEKEVVGTEFLLCLYLRSRGRHYCIPGNRLEPSN